jgi:hypothetical protein
LLVATGVTCELAAGLEPPPHVLIDEDAPPSQNAHWAESCRNLSAPYGPLEYGVRLMRTGYFSSYLLYRREQLHSIPHLVHLLLAVVQADITPARPRRGPGREEQRGVKEGRRR